MIVEQQQIGSVIYACAFMLLHDSLATCISPLVICGVEYAECSLLLGGLRRHLSQLLLVALKRCYDHIFIHALFSRTIYAESAVVTMPHQVL